MEDAAYIKVMLPWVCLQFNVHPFAQKSALSLKARVHSRLNIQLSDLPPEK